MGDPLADIEDAISEAIAATNRATVELDEMDDHEFAASVGKAVDAARFSLLEARRRLGR